MFQESLLGSWTVDRCVLTFPPDTQPLGEDSEGPGSLVPVHTLHQLCDLGQVT